MNDDECYPVGRVSMNSAQAMSCNDCKALPDHDCNANGCPSVEVLRVGDEEEHF